MRKNQKSKSVMYRIIEQWQSSGLSQSKFCRGEKLSKSTFGYWLGKYKKEKSLPVNVKERSHKTFIPVEVSDPRTKNDIPDSNRIEVFFPNGIQVNCPVGIDMQQLRTLINI